MIKSMLLLSVLGFGVLVQGCKSSNVVGVPEGAKLIQESNANATFTATEKGMIFIRDQPADSVIYQGPVNAGQKLVVDAKENRVTLDGHRVITTAPLRPDGVYQVFFKAQEVHAYHPMMNP